MVYSWRPLLVKEITDPNNEVVERFEPTELEQVISPQVAQQMVTMMEVVVEDGTAKRGSSSWIQSRRKTGTAKKAPLEAIQTQTVSALSLD